MDRATNSNMYTTYASYYDLFYQSKNYTQECSFLHTLFSEYHIKTVLDVGCGTGTHLSILETYGYSCEGIDFNSDMLKLAEKKLKGNVFQADMRSFNLNKQYDASTSLFAVFNHNLTLHDANTTLLNLKAHLKKDGILILDLYNPQSSGRKSNSVGEITKSMEWNLHNKNHICESTVSFLQNNTKLYEEKFPLRIYSISEMKGLLTKAGFETINVYDNFTFTTAHDSSKNLVFVAQ